MKRLLLALAIPLAGIAGTARADTFSIVPTAALALPSAEVPNTPGQLALRPDWTSAPAQPRTLSFAELQALWQHAGAAYGIPWQVLAAINKIESNFGRNMGPSSAGAIGWMQFIPSTWLRWGLDASGDGNADPWDPEDAVFAAARYLAAAGGRTDISRGVFAYNHAQWYVDEVLQLARVFGAGGPSTAFSLYRVQQSLTDAQRAVVRANRALVAALARARALERQKQRLLARADRADLLSTRLELEKQAGLVDARRAAVAARAERLRASLEDAETDLSKARDEATSSSFGAAGDTLGAPAYQDGYVFPVGGGPSVVSVGHTHHDYPAADIAAPAGSPVYALADAIVLRAWRYPDPRCGIGVTLRTSDNLTWTYCHLAYLDPTVRRGTAVAAGAPVGLVGSTGDATGPHLHLQLQPPTSYPQEQPWFQRFAGTAFRWQGEAAPAAAPTTQPHPVFAVVERRPQSVVTFTR